MTFTHTVNYSGNGTGAIGEAASDFNTWLKDGLEQGTLKCGEDFEYTDWGEDDDEDNARFIAAAPDAVRMLKVAVEGLEFIVSKKYGTPSLIAQQTLTEIKGEGDD